MIGEKPAGTTSDTPTDEVPITDKPDKPKLLDKGTDTKEYKKIATALAVRDAMVGQVGEQSVEKSDLFREALEQALKVNPQELNRDLAAQLKEALETEKDDELKHKEAADRVVHLLQQWGLPQQAEIFQQRIAAKQNKASATS